MKASDNVGKVLEKLKGDKRLAIIVAIGLVGILLLTLSEFIPSKDTDNKKNEETTEAQEESATYEDYQKDIEGRLTGIIGSIDGVGKTKVMITLDTGDENVYAAKEKNSSSDTGNSNEKEYIIIDNNGEDGGLLLKVIEPEVRGVAVVCEGAGSSQVRQEIVRTVTAVLGISSNRVNIAKMKKQ